MADRVIIPTDASLNVQRAVQQLQAQIDALSKQLGSAGDVSSTDLDKLRTELTAQINKSIYQQDHAEFTPNDVFRGAGPAHAPGVVPDTGPNPYMVGDEPVLTITGQWQRVLDGIVRVVPSLRSNPGMDGDHSLAQRVVNVLGALAVLNGLSAASVRTRELFAYRMRTPLTMKSDAVGAGVAEIQPNAVSGLQGWWKADAGVYVDAGVTGATNTQTVQQWNDQSGNARHLSQSTAGYRPQYLTNIVNGKPAIKFFGQGDFRYLTSGTIGASLVSASANTIFAVWYINNPPYGTPLSSLDGSSTYWVTEIAWSGTGGSAVISAAGYDGAYRTVGKTSAVGTWYSSTHLHTGGNLYTGLNDTRDASMSSVACGNLTGLTNSIAYVGAVAGGYLDGYVAEVIVYNTALSESDRKGVEAYLANKYGVTLGYSVVSPYNSTDYIKISDANEVPAFRVNYQGRVCIGDVASPNYSLHLAADSAGKPSTSTWSVVSDEKTKQDITPSTVGLDAVNSLTPIKFKYKEDFGLPSEEEAFGVSADQLATVFPEAVTERVYTLPSGETTLLKTVSYHHIIVMLLGAVRELSAKVDALTPGPQPK